MESKQGQNSLHEMCEIMPCQDCLSMLMFLLNTLRTVGHCGRSEVKNYINTVQFLAQTDYFVS